MSSSSIRCEPNGFRAFAARFVVQREFLAFVLQTMIKCTLPTVAQSGNPNGLKGEQRLSGSILGCNGLFFIVLLRRLGECERGSLNRYDCSALSLCRCIAFSTHPPPFASVAGKGLDSQALLRYYPCAS